MITTDIAQDIAQPIAVDLDGAAFALSDLFDTQDGLAFAIRDATLYQESSKTTAADADGDPIGAALDQSGNGYEFLQATAAARPLLNINGNTWSAIFDGSDDVLSTGSIGAFTGGAVVIAGTSGIWWDNDHDHPGGAFEYGNKSGLSNTYTGGPSGIADIVGELIGVVVRDTALSDAEWAQVLGFYKARGAPGLIALEENIADPYADADFVGSVDEITSSGFTTTGAGGPYFSVEAGDKYLAEYSSTQTQNLVLYANVGGLLLKHESLTTYYKGIITPADNRGLYQRLSAAGSADVTVCVLRKVVMPEV